jgi:DNA primase
MGTALTQEQCRLLARFADEVVIGYDGDPAGEEASRRALPLLLTEDLEVLRPRFPAGHDPDSLRLELGSAALVELLERAPDAVTEEIERITPPGTAREPRLQARAAHEVGRVLKPIKDRVLRFGYARQAGERMGVPAELLLSQTGSAATVVDRSGSSGGAKIVRSVEEKLLQLLCADGEEVPAVEDLPPEEAFLDPIWRNIYRAFFDVYREDGRRPDAKVLLARLPQEGETVDRAARLLLEGTAGSRPGELGEAVVQLERRWQQQRLRDLSVQIAEAQRSGDEKRLDRLLGEKTALSRRLHGHRISG